jgi:flagellar basal body-associated protein FliL
MNGYVILIIVLFILCCAFGFGFFWWMHLLDETQDKYHEKVQRVEELEKKIKSLTEPIRIETYMTEPVNINLSFELSNSLSPDDERFKAILVNKLAEAIIEHENIYTMTGRVESPLSFTTIYNFQTRFIPYVTGEERFL